MKRIIYLLTFIVLFICHACSSSTSTTPDPVADLRIVNDSWTSDDPKHLFGGSELNVHTFTIVNKSDQYAYRRIAVRFDYFNKDHTLIDSTQSMVYKTVAHNDTLLVDKMHTTFINPLTASAKVRILSATKE